MYNNTGVKREQYGNTNQILLDVGNQSSISIVVDESVGVSRTDGKKIAKAGTILVGSLEDRTTPFVEYSGTKSLSETTTTTTTYQDMGVLLHDVDVTLGDNNGTFLMFGFVNTNRLESDVKAKITDDVKAKLTMIRFAAG